MSVCLWPRSPIRFSSHFHQPQIQSSQAERVRSCMSIRALEVYASTACWRNRIHVPLAGTRIGDYGEAVGMLDPCNKFGIFFNGP